MASNTDRQINWIGYCPFMPLFIVSFQTLHNDGSNIHGDYSRYYKNLFNVTTVYPGVKEQITHIKHVRNIKDYVWCLWEVPGGWCLVSGENQTKRLSCMLGLFHCHLQVAFAILSCISISSDELCCRYFLVFNSETCSTRNISKSPKNMLIVHNICMF